MLGDPPHEQLGAPLVQEVLVQDVRMEVTVMQRSVRDVTVRFPCTDLSFLIILKKKKKEALQTLWYIPVHSPKVHSSSNKATVKP